MSTAEMFEDDLMKIVMRRLSVRLQTNNANPAEIEVLLVDNKTGHGVLCTGTKLQISAELKVTNGNVHGGMPRVFYEAQ